MDTLFLVITFLLPCWLVNIGLNGLYVIKKYYPRAAFFDRPLDFGLVLGANRLLGESTTMAGLVCAPLLGMVVGAWCGIGSTWGLVVGVSVYGGHALGSFIKRRCGYGDGAFMPVVDHADSIALTGVVLAWCGVYSWSVVGFGVILNLVLQPGWSFVWHKLGLRRYPW